MTEPNRQAIGVDGQPLVDEYQRYRKFGSWLIIGAFVLLVIVLSIGAWFDAQATTQTTDKLGVHLLLDDGRNRWDEALWPAHMAAADAIVSDGGIAVQVIRSDDLDVARWQQFLDLADQHQMTPVLRLATTFDRENGWWNTPEASTDGSYRDWGQRYAAFLNRLAWHSNEKHIILLNEPNNGHEWGGIPDPEAYARFVVDVTDVLRAEVENVVILNAAFDLNLPNTNNLPFPDSNVILMDADSYISRMEAAEAGIFGRFDLWNSHPYPLDIRAHPEQQRYGFDAMNGAALGDVRPPDGIFNRGINGYEWSLWKLAQLGYAVDDLSVMITETGWRHNAPVDAQSADAGADYPSPDEIAQFYELAFFGDANTTFTPWAEDERVLAVAPFALNGVPDEWSHTNLLQMTAEGDITGRYAHYEALAAIATAE